VLMSDTRISMSFVSRVPVSGDLVNQAFCLVCIQVVSLYTMDKAIGAPTPLCRRGVNDLRKHVHRQFMQTFGRGVIHVPPFNSTQPVSIFGCMQVTKDSMLTYLLNSHRT
jgi:hypothetical protein